MTKSTVGGESSTTVPTERLADLSRRWHKTSRQLLHYVIYERLTCYVHLIQTPARVANRSITLTGDYRVPIKEAARLLKDPVERSTSVVAEERDRLAEINKESAYTMNDLLVKRDEIERFEREEFPNKKDKAPRRSQLARAAVRAVAALLWKQDPTLNIEQMLDRPELRTFGLNLAGHRLYESDTIRLWIHDLCPNPKPGRPRKTD